MKLFNNNLSAAYNIVKPFVTYFSGNRALATVDMVNEVINNMNGRLGNAPASHVYLITETPGVAPLTFTQFKTSVGVSGGCDCCGCVDGAITDSCDKTTTYSKCSNPQISANRTAPGVYDLNLNIANPSDFGGFAVRFGNISTLGIIINLTRISPTHYRVTAYNTQTGAAEDNTLTDAIVEVLVWG